ncbi:hypothetical protein EVAR_73715_1, partial [Eumeta japonica]
KPWLRTEWGDKVRELQFSNCTAEAADGNSTPLPSNDVNNKYVRSTVFNGGSRNELSDEEMKRLEDQIVPSALSYKRMPSNKFNTPSPSITEKSIVYDQEQQETVDTTTTLPIVDNNYSNGQENAETESPSTSTTEIGDDQALDTNQLNCHNIR